MIYFISCNYIFVTHVTVSICPRWRNKMYLFILNNHEKWNWGCNCKLLIFQLHINIKHWPVFIYFYNSANNCYWAFKTNLQTWKIINFHIKCIFISEKKNLIRTQIFTFSLMWSHTVIKIEKYRHDFTRDLIADLGS